MPNKTNFLQGVDEKIDYRAGKTSTSMPNKIEKCIGKLKKAIDKKEMRDLLREIDRHIPLGGSWIYVEKLIKDFLKEQRTQDLKALKDEVEGTKKGREVEEILFEEELERPKKDYYKDIGFNQALSEVIKLIEKYVKTLSRPKKTF